MGGQQSTPAALRRATVRDALAHSPHWRTLARDGSSRGALVAGSGGSSGSISSSTSGGALSASLEPGGPDGGLTRSGSKPVVATVAVLGAEAPLHAALDMLRRVDATSLPVAAEGGDGLVKGGPGKGAKLLTRRAVLKARPPRRESERFHEPDAAVAARLEKAEEDAAAGAGSGSGAGAAGDAAAVAADLAAAKLEHAPAGVLCFFDMRGVLDLMFLPFRRDEDLVRLAAKAATEAEADAGRCDSSDSEPEDEARHTLASLGPSVLNQPVSAVAGSHGGRGGRNLLAAALETPLVDVLDAMVANDTRRVLVTQCSRDDAPPIVPAGGRVPSTKGTVFNDDIHHDDLLAVLTPTDILRWCHRHIDDKRSCQELAFGVRTVFTLPTSATVAEAFLELTRHNTNALAVVTEDRVVVRSFGSRLARFLTQENFGEVMAMNVVAAICKFQPQEPVLCNASRVNFNDIVYQLLSQRQRVAWLTDDRGHPVGVFTVSDVVRRLHLAVHPELDADIPRLAFKEE